MSFVNMEITSKQCDALIFFPNTQGTIYHFEDNYRSRMFSTKAINPIHICQGYCEMHSLS